MPQYLAPDVYLEEVVSGNQPIEGVSTSFTGFVGMTQRGPSSGLPQLVTSFADFQNQYGGYFDFGLTFAGHNTLPFAVDGFFTNLGKVLYISRVTAPGAFIANATSQGGLVTRLLQDTSVSAALQKQVRPTTLRGIQAGAQPPVPGAAVGTKMQLRMVKQGISTDSPTVTVTAVDRTTGIVTIDTALATVFEARYTTVFTDTGGLDAAGAIVPLASPLSARPNSFVISAANKGSWGNNISISAFHESAGRAVVDTFLAGALDNNTIQMKSTANFYVNAWVEIDGGNTKHYRKVLAVNGLVITLAGPAMAAADVAPELAAPNNITYFSTTEFRLIVSFNGQTEQYTGMTIENVPGRYCVDRINPVSSLIQVGTPAVGGPPFLFPSGADGLSISLLNGLDGTAAPGDPEYIGQDLGPGQRTGIQALTDIDALSLVAVPGITTQGVQGALIAHCEAMRFRFAVLDPTPKEVNPPVSGDLNDIQNQRDQFDTKYAAIYYPRIVIENLMTGTTIPVAPSGHICGVYARVDDLRGVHKAPANEIIAGAQDYEVIINKTEQEILNPEPNNINVLRDFRHSGRGLRVWGARCMTSDTQWKYINVRRLFIFIEKSLEEGLQWAVFEPNDYRLWARVTQSVGAFLTRVWRDGALMGLKPEQAFFIKCDRTTMTQDDIDNGRLIMLIGVAPVYPAEFVVVRIGIWSGGSSVQEL
jgi:phage tail sheath protein FI